MRIAVTGSNGFIGSSICQLAGSTGHAVLGISRGSSATVEFKGEYHQADVATANLASIFSAFAPDLVVHAAGCASVASSIAESLEDLKGSVVPWANVLESIRKSAVRPLVFFTSSAAVYGNGSGTELKENCPPNPISPYGFHKQLCEILAREYAECHGVTSISVRLFSVFGPRQRRLLVWDIFRKVMASGGVLSFDGTGEETRDYLSVEEVASAVLKLGEVIPRDPALHLINLARGESTRIRSLCELAIRLLKCDKAIQFSGVSRAGDPQRWDAGTDALRRLLPVWQPDSLETSLQRCLGHWQCN